MYLNYIQGKKDVNHIDDNTRTDKLLYHVTLGHAANKTELYTPNGTSYNYDTYGKILIAFEIFTIGIFSIFITSLMENQKNYIKHFKGQTIEMDDFAIKVMSMPRDVQFGC